MERLTLRGVRFAALALPIAILFTSAVAPAQRLVLHNHLDDAVSVENSVVGPNLQFSTITSMQHVVANPAFVEAVINDGLTTTSDFVDPALHAHNVLLTSTDTLLSPERGTIQLWARIDEMPVAGVRDNFRLFSGPGELDYSGIQLYAYDHGGEPYLRLVMRPHFDVPPPGQVVDVVVEYLIADHIGRWMQIDAVWDRDGIAANGDTLRLYVDGQLVGKTNEASWGYYFGPIADIGGGDGMLANAFVVDEIRIWDAARPPIAEPAFFTIGEGCPGAFGTPRLDARTGDRPYTGTMFTMCVTNLPDPRWCAVWAFVGTNRESLYGLPLPLDLEIVGMPGCDLYLAPDGDVLLPNHNGSVDWSLLIPNQPGFAGVRFYTQMVVLDPTANAFGAILSNACEGRIGVMQ